MGQIGTNTMGANATYLKNVPVCPGFPWNLKFLFTKNKCIKTITIGVKLIKGVPLPKCISDLSNWAIPQSSSVPFNFFFFKMNWRTGNHEKKNGVGRTNCETAELLNLMPTSLHCRWSVSSYVHIFYWFLEEFNCLGFYFSTKMLTFPLNELLVVSWIANLPSPQTLLHALHRRSLVAPETMSVY